MNSKERVLTALNHEEPDKVPIDIWLNPETTNELINGLNLDQNNDKYVLQKLLGHDLLYFPIGILDGFSSIYMEERKIGDNLYIDKFGIKWRKKIHKYGEYCEFAEHPFDKIDNYYQYKWPDPIISEKQALEEYQSLVEKDGKEHAILGAVAGSLIEGSWYLRGLENFLTDILINRDFAEELMDKVMHYHLILAKKLTEMGVDIIWIGDDISTERGPLFSPKIFNDLIKHRYAFMISEIRKVNKNIKIAFHSDGAVEWALNDLIDVGVDIINPLQPDVNDVVQIKKKYGNKLSFWGNVDTRNIMSNGKTVEVLNEVRNVISILSPGGGHILCSNHTVQSTPRALDNVIAYYWSAERYGKYPLHLY